MSDSPTGPFRVVEEDIGPGPHVTWYRAKDGSHVLYANGLGYVSGEAELRVRIRAEQGFDPKTDTAFDSVRCGAPSAGESRPPRLAFALRFGAGRFP